MYTYIQMAWFIPSLEIAVRPVICCSPRFILEKQIKELICDNAHWSDDFEADRDVKRSMHVELRQVLYVLCVGSQSRGPPDTNTTANQRTRKTPNRIAQSDQRRAQPGSQTNFQCSITSHDPEKD